jgi:hypothetical protein
MPAREAQLAQQRSDELQRLLGELAREHATNQALMRQELAFLDHLLNLIEPLPSLGYAASGTRSSMPAAPLPGHQSLDLHS